MLEFWFKYRLINTLVFRLVQQLSSNKHAGNIKVLQLNHFDKCKSFLN